MRVGGFDYWGGWVSVIEIISKLTCGCMAAFKNFEEMVVWKEARIVSQSIFLITNKTAFNNDPKLRWQMRGSSGSIIDNIAEGFSLGGTKEFIQFLRIANGSAGELISQHNRCNDRNWIEIYDFKMLYLKIQKISSMPQGPIQYLQSTTRKGPTHQ